MKEIHLTQGKIALVDDEDFERVNQHKWYAHKDGNTYYALRKTYFGGKRINQRMHRFIMGVFVDHKDHNGLNNQKCNLRLAEELQNSYNRIKSEFYNGKPTTSIFKGVHKRKNRWYSHIRVNQKSIYLGCFCDEKEAAKAYDKAAKMYFGEFARLNFE